jgi:uncharacterized membrane protein YeaQ/YmgE (transglycosylase-associated protein family)
MNFIIAIFVGLVAGSWLSFVVDQREQGNIWGTISGLGVLITGAIIGWHITRLENKK